MCLNTNSFSKKCRSLFRIVTNHFLIQESLSSENDFLFLFDYPLNRTWANYFWTNNATISRTVKWTRRTELKIERKIWRSSWTKRSSLLVMVLEKFYKRRLYPPEDALIGRNRCIEIFSVFYCETYTKCFQLWKFILQNLWEGQLGNFLQS